MTNTAGAADKITDAIIAAIDEGYTGPDQLLILAEALAWVRQPGQGHGTSSTPS